MGLGMNRPFQKIAAGFVDAITSAPAFQWGRKAASQPTSGPFTAKEIPMASVATITPKKQPTAGTVNWFNECVERSHKEPFVTRAVISPGLASVILSMNPDNRNLSPVKAEHYASDMAHGRWADNGETIIISSDGQLNDGQHRMQALIDSNCSLPFFIAFGVTRESRTTVDQGKARSAGDYLAMDGIAYASNASTAAKFIIAYERSNGRNIALRSKLTNAEVVARVKADADIISAAAWGHKYYKHYRSLFSLTIMSACYYILSEIHPSDAEEYLSKVAMGENIKRKDAAFAVRQAFMRETTYERQEALEIIFHGWNKFRQGKDAVTISPSGNNVFPALV